MNQAVLCIREDSNRSKNGQIKCLQKNLKFYLIQSNKKKQTNKLHISFKINFPPLEEEKL